MERPGLTRCRTLRDQEARPAARRELRRQQDRIVSHQGQGWRGRLATTGGFERLVEAERPSGELPLGDECQHRRASLCRWRLVGLADPVEAQVINARHGAAFGGIDRDQGLMQPGDRPLCVVKLAQAAAGALFDRLEDVGGGEAGESLGAELGSMGPELSTAPVEGAPVGGLWELSGPSFPSV